MVLQGNLYGANMAVINISLAFKGFLFKSDFFFFKENFDR